MSRTMLDDIVRNNAIAASVFLDDIANTTYIGTVQTNKPKITLEESQYGIGDESVTAQLEVKFNAMKSDEDGYIIFRTNDKEKKVHATGEQIAMLKALAVEQINLCNEYSEIVSDMFWQLLWHITQGGTDMPFKLPVDASKLRTEVVCRFSEFIMKQLKMGGYAND